MNISVQFKDLDDTSISKNIQRFMDAILRLISPFNSKLKEPIHSFDKLPTTGANRPSPIQLSENHVSTFRQSKPDTTDNINIAMSKQPNSPKEDRGQFQLSPFEFLIVASVYACFVRKSSYGADIWEELTSSTGREYASGAVYTGLNRLLKQGFVTKQKLSDGKQHYSVTLQGMNALKQSRQDYQNLVRLSAFVEGSDI